jgi:hypothetical protein
MAQAFLHVGEGDESAGTSRETRTGAQGHRFGVLQRAACKSGIDSAKEILKSDAVSRHVDRRRVVLSLQ